MLKAFPELPFFNQLQKHAVEQQSKAAIVDVGAGFERSYAQLVEDVALVKNALLKLKGADSDLAEARVGHMVPNGYAAVVVQLAIWAAGGISLPLLPTHPLPELRYTATDSGAELIVVHHKLDDRSFNESKINGLCECVNIDPARVLVVGDSPVLPSEGAASDTSGIPSSSQDVGSLPALEDEEHRRAMIIYTSGSTGTPKGVVTTHRALRAQIESLVEFWRWTPDDRVLHVLPLNHVHGLVNALHCALWTGATVEMLPKFEAGAVWQRFMDPRQDLTLFMAVPTVYSRLMAQHASMSPEDQKKGTESCKQFRLMISGSAPLPSSAKRAWAEISGGQVLLERYGMSETCMLISCGYEVERRVDGHVGTPLPGVEVRLWNTDGDKEVTSERETEGEIQVRGPGVFSEYWGRPEATAKEFLPASDGGRPWFKTGDIGLRTDDQLGGLYRILGRSSVDIIKTGGEKVSALDVERAILALSGINDAVVVGVPDPEWGQRIAAIVVPKEGERKGMEIKELRDELRKSIAAYKLPSKLKVVDDLPRNPMGKVQKKELVKMFTEAQ